jgi:AraC-like DNA-binding protein
MNTPARTLRPVTASWQASDPVLAALRAARARRDQADRDIRILLAYARELATPRPYRLADLADATGKSISGVRTAYTDRDVSAARRILHDISHAQGAAQRSKDGGHDLRHPPC